MIRTVARVVGSTLLVLLLCSATVFLAGNLLAPGNAATVLEGAEGATPEEHQQLEHRLGLDRPLIVQYADWLVGAAHGDFGTSPISHRQATAVIAQELPVSLELALLTFLLATLIGVPLGVMAAVWAGKPVDYLLRIVTLTGLSLPVFVLGTLLVLVASAYAPALYSVSFVPLFSDPSANLKGMLLPMIAAAIPNTAQVLQFTRGNLLESLSQPFVTMAYARGIPRWRVYFVHAMKNTLPPLVTFQGFQLGGLLGSLFITETIFSLPGLARGVISSIDARDYTVLEAEVMVIATAFIVGNLVVDLLVPLIDPRKRAA